MERVEGVGILSFNMPKSKCWWQWNIINVKLWFFYKNFSLLRAKQQKISIDLSLQWYIQSCLRIKWNIKPRIFFNVFVHIISAGSLPLKNKHIKKSWVKILQQKILFLILTKSCHNFYFHNIANWWNKYLKKKLNKCALLHNHSTHTYTSPNNAIK